MDRGAKDPAARPESVRLNANKGEKTIMALWYWYVFASAILSFEGYITLDAFLLAVLAVLVHVQFHFLASQNRAVTGLKTAVTGAMALALLWHTSYLPAPSTLVTFLADPATRPTFSYMLEFAGQSMSLPMILGGLALFALVFLMARKRPVSLVGSAYCIIAAAWLLQPRHAISDLIGDSPARFYEQERGKVVKFTPPAAGAPPFDIIFLHICSLSWEDMRDAGYDPVPFFSKFDYVFTNFSAGCTYSGPAVLRLMKAPCGHVTQAQLVAPSPAGCYLMDDLRGSGYKIYSAFNHDGTYADFTNVVQKMSHGEPPLTSNNLEPKYRMFDGKVLYSDRSELIAYLKARAEANVPRAALYYNTVNLHIGTHKMIPDPGPDTTADYGKRLAAMLAEFEDVFSMIERSGRNAVVVFVPEHGAALKGSKMQARDVREIPLPAIATVPVAVKLIGKSFYAGPKPRVITKPTSVYALAWLLADFLRRSPFTKDAETRDEIALKIPATDFLAENDHSAVMRVGPDYIYRNKDANWAKLPAYALIPAGTIPSPADFGSAASQENRKGAAAP